MVSGIVWRFRLRREENPFDPVRAPEEHEKRRATVRDAKVCRAGATLAGLAAGWWIGLGAAGTWPWAFVVKFAAFYAAFLLCVVAVRMMARRGMSESVGRGRASVSGLRAVEEVLCDELRYVAGAALFVSLLLTLWPAAAQAQGTTGPVTDERGAVALPVAVAPRAPSVPDRRLPPPPGAELWEEYALTDEQVGRTARQRMPFTAEQMERILQLVAGYQETIERASRPQPELRAREIVLSLDAREAAPVVAIQKDYTSGVALVDGTGEPWPVEMVLVEESFGPVETKDGGHTVYFTPSKRFLHGNAIIELVGLTTPIVLELKAGNGVVDTRLLARVPRPGPNADPITVERTEEFAPGDPVISALLHGAAPPDAERIEVRGGTTSDRAWRVNGSVYLRTEKTLLAPQPQASERGANGDTVYRLADSPYAMVSLDGARVRLEFAAGEDG